MQSGNPVRSAVKVSRDQFGSCFRMLTTLVDICPDAVWRACYYGFQYPVWYQAYHTAYFVDYWFRDVYDGREFRSMAFDDRIMPEFEREVPEGVTISREDMQCYLALLEKKIDRFFDALTDDQLLQPVFPGQDLFTYLDVIMSQVRHVMYNVGYLNGILRGLDLPESDWYAYNEQDDQDTTF